MPSQTAASTSKECAIAPPNRRPMESISEMMSPRKSISEMISPRKSVSGMRSPRKSISTAVDRMACQYLHKLTGDDVEPDGLGFKSELQIEIVRRKSRGVGTPTPTTGCSPVKRRGPLGEDGPWSWTLPAMQEEPLWMSPCKSPTGEYSTVPTPMRRRKPMAENQELSPVYERGETSDAFGSWTQT